MPELFMVPRLKRIISADTWFDVLPYQDAQDLARFWNVNPGSEGAKFYAIRSVRYPEFWQVVKEYRDGCPLNGMEPEAIATWPERSLCRMVKRRTE